MTIQSFKQLALSFPGTTEQPHFEKRSYRLNNKIFATLDEAHKRACIKLDEINQSVFCSMNPTGIYPVNNKWGKQGWTIVELNAVDKKVANEMLQLGLVAITKKKKPHSKD